MRTFTKAYRIFLLLAAVALVALAGCGGKEVTRTEVDEQIDLSGYWNDTDSRMVAAALIEQSYATPWIEDFRAEEGKRPYVIIGTVRNRTSEHIAVNTFIKDLETKYINDGRVRVVATADEREEIRSERADQQEFSSEETMKHWGLEKGADYMFIGEINLITDQEGGESVRYYQVDCNLVDLEDNVKVWAGGEKIKKYIKQ